MRFEIDPEHLLTAADKERIQETEVQEWAMVNRIQQSENVDTFSFFNEAVVKSTLSPDGDWVLYIEKPTSGCKPQVSDKGASAGQGVVKLCRQVC